MKTLFSAPQHERLLPAIVRFIYTRLAITAAALALVATLGAIRCDGAAPQPLAERTAEGFLVPQPGRLFQFPRDHGSHPEFKVEWWYITGHLFSASEDPTKQERFGFQATFFRRASTPPSPENGTATNRFRADELHLFHAALIETRTGKFTHSERLARGGWDASSSLETLDVRNGWNSLTFDQTQPDMIQLESRIRDEIGLSLRLNPLKPLVVFGEDGVSRKGDSSDAASWYLTFPRLHASGTLRTTEGTFQVQGEAWMDHEISSSQLSSNQAGWDWAGIQLNDGREIMVYRLRRTDGSTDPASALFWVGAAHGEGKAETHRVSAEDFRWEASGKWRSPHSNATYPVPVRLRALDPATGTTDELVLEPLANDQELESSLSGVPYWEGACRVLRAGKIVGSAYVELTGYAGSLNRALR